jgi:DNA-binding transcriptional MerR regulator
VKIGELSSRSGRSIHAIRWYEAQGLIPGVERDGSGHRVYTDLHVGWLDLMDRLRRTGMSIAQMREYTALVRKGRSTLDQRHALLTAHRTRVRDTIAEWTAALTLIQSKIDYYGEWLATGTRPRQPRGVTPNSARKARVKFETSPKPQSSATSTILPGASVNRAAASRRRARRMY